MTVAFDWAMRSRVALDRRIEQYAATLRDGLATDWSAYKHITGQIAGLKEAQRIMQETVSAAVEPDERKALHDDQAR